MRTYFLGFLVLAACGSAPKKAAAPRYDAIARPAAVNVADAGVYVPNLIERRVGIEPGRGQRIVLASRTVKTTTSRVTVEYCIDETGRVTSAQAVGSNAMLGEVARDMVMQWQFAPFFVDGTPAAACSYVSVSVGAEALPVTVSSR